MKKMPVQFIATINLLLGKGGPVDRYGVADFK